MGDAVRRKRRGDGGRAYRDRREARNPLPALARDALLDLHRLARLPRQRGRVQGDGPRGLRTPFTRVRGTQGAAAHEGRRTRARPVLLRLPPVGEELVFGEVRGRVRTGARPLGPHRSFDGPWAPLRGGGGVRAARPG